MAFQELEELVSCLIGLLISDDNQLGLIITSELSFRNKLGLLYSLYLYRTATPQRPEDLKKLLARLRRVEERRNTILHSYWVKSPVCGMLIRYKYAAKPAKGFVQDVEDLQPEHIEAIAAEIGLVADDLILYFDKAFPTTTKDKISQALQTSREGAYKHAPPRRCESRIQVREKRSAFIGAHNETLSVALSLNNEDIAPL